ncbi:MAG: DMT family transporter [Methyloligellaceae bacterium]
MSKVLPSPVSVLTEPRILFAIILMCASSIPFSIMDASVKYLGEYVGVAVAQIIWIRFLAHIFFTVILIGPKAVPGALAANRPWLQLLRSVFLLGATGFNFYALKTLQLDQTVTIFFLSPLVVAALAGPILGEWVGWRRLIAICVGFIGVVIVMQPTVEGIKPAFLLAFCAAISYSCYNICTRYLSTYDSTATTQLFSPFAGLIAVSPFAFMQWSWSHDWITWIILLSLGITGGFGHWLLIVAHRHAPVSTLAPFVYAGLISMVIVGYLFFGDLPTDWTIIGGSVVITSGIYLLYRERVTKENK